MRRIPFLLCILFILEAQTCAIKGDFGWASRDHRELSALEKSIFRENQYEIKRSRIHFYDYESIWGIYQIQKGFYWDNDFLVGLYENKKAPQPVLLSLRKAEIYEGDCCDYLRYHYPMLEAGSYLLRIAYASEIIDEAPFLVFAPETLSPDRGDLEDKAQY